MKMRIFERNIMNEHGLVLIRNSDFAFDSIMKREADTALKIGMKVFVLSWIRDTSTNHPVTIQLKYGAVRVSYFYRKAEFSRGFKNAFHILRFNIWVYRQLLALKNEYKVLIACDLDVVFPAYIISKLYNKKIIYDIIDSYAQNHPMPMVMKRVFEKIENKIISLVDAVIVCNEVRQSLIEKAMPKKCIVVHNTPDVEKYSGPPQKICKHDNSNFKVAYCGTLTPNGRLLTEIIQQANKYQEVELHIGGFGPLADYINGLAQKSSNIVFYGQLQNENALQLQSECDLLFATYDPSIEINKYSAPLKLYEAMALSKPIIVCKGTTADEVTLSNNMGVVISYNADEFWDAVIYLSRNKELCRTMGRCGRKAYDEVFSWKIMEERLATLFNMMI